MSQTMELLNFKDLNLPLNALKFTQHYSLLVNKPIQILSLPDNYPNFGCTSESPALYTIGIKLGAIDWESTFCHELFHVYQCSQGFPTVIGFSPDTEKFCEHLRSTVLDLSANEALQAYGLTYTNIIKFRYRQLIKLRDSSFSKINSQYVKDLFVIDLILDLSDFSTTQCENILPTLKHHLPDVYEKYLNYRQIIFEKNDYHTAEGCLNIFAHIFEDIGLWNACTIKYKGNEIRTLQTFKRIIQSSALE